MSGARAGFAFLLAALVVDYVATSNGASRADPDNTEQVAFGAKAYAEHCASCHGAHLEGQPDWRVRKADGRLPAPPHDYHGHTWRHSDDELFGMVKQGMAPYAPPGYQTDMAAFAGVLTDDEIWAVLAYIKSNWPPEFRTYQSKITGGAVGRGTQLHH